MKRTLIAVCLISVSTLITIKVLAACGSYFQPEGSDTFSGVDVVSVRPPTGVFSLPMAMKPTTFRSQQTASVSQARRARLMLVFLDMIHPTSRQLLSAWVVGRGTYSW